MEFLSLEFFLNVLIGILLSLILVAVLIYLLARVVKLYTTGPAEKSVPVGEPLFLTPFIRDGLNSLARELSKVQNLTPEVRGYSGFITVNGSTNANMFFWFFPAQNSSSTAPVIFWCTGGPGSTGLLSLFVCNGPYEVDEKLKLTLRENSWHLEYNIIFIDYPIGAGFSFSDNEDGILKSSTDPEHMYDFLIQFYTMFPEYLKNDFYAGGNSFGGIFAPSIAHKIHMENLREGSLKINLKGLILDCPWSDPVRQVNFGGFLYTLGLLDQFDREHFDLQAKLFENHINSERWNDAFKIYCTLFAETSSLFKHCKLGQLFVYNFTWHYGKLELGVGNYVQFVEQDFVRNAIHVGNRKFTPFNFQSWGLLEDKGLKSVKPFIETLLNAKEDYRVLIYAGQMDIITNHLGIRSMIDAFDWHGGEKFRETKAQPWMNNNNDYVIGSVTSVPNLTYLFVRNHGHCVSGPCGLGVLNEFTKSLPLTNQN